MRTTSKWSFTSPFAQMRPGLLFWSGKGHIGWSNPSTQLSENFFGAGSRVWPLCRPLAVRVLSRLASDERAGTAPIVGRRLEPLPGNNLLKRFQPAFGED